MFFKTNWKRVIKIWSRCVLCHHCDVSFTKSELQFYYFCYGNIFDNVKITFFVVH